ncbi:MAG: rRNA maturation RNase YbeY [Patescibacteria group bacterium]|nr:rRNA maturation RNase YbeY [Patescibacteria group bacterium]MDE2015381.1 rRNA maturation RNase YbeY [Patescibacteria group bacterium]MDE2227004.1 rRNA maturation RNase YbeY [Patescibacteria group bacterium]
MKRGGGGGTLVFSEKRAAMVVRNSIRLLGFKKSKADVFLLSGNKMKDLKARFYGHRPEKAVDVLSFPEPSDFPSPEIKAKFLGEIYLNKDIARTDTERSTFLVIHGLLHLLGYTHDKKNAILKMERLEKRLVEKIFWRL